MKPDAPITSTANPTVKWLKSLALKKHRDEEGLFTIEGLRDATAAAAAGWDLHMLVTTPDIRNTGLAPERSLSVTPELMSRIVNRDNAQAVLGVFRQRWASPDSLGRGLWLGLEDIRDPGNLGTILRTADAVSAAGIVLIGQTCDPFSPEAVKAAMGSLPRIPLLRMTRESFATWRQGAVGTKVIGTHLKGAVDYRAVEYGPDMVVLMGSETAGLSDALAALCDHRVKIPMSGPTESLNLGIASALMLYEARRAVL